MNLARVRMRKQDDIIIDEDQIIQFADKHFEYHSRQQAVWNGRQIRNVVQTATAMAEYEAMDTLEDAARDWEEGDLKNVKPHLKAEHFQTVAHASDQFDLYISETIGYTDAERASIQTDRADDLKWAATHSEKRQRTFDRGGWGGGPPSQRQEYFPSQHDRGMRQDPYTQEPSYMYSSGPGSLQQEPLNSYSNPTFYSNSFRGPNPAAMEALSDPEKASEYRHRQMMESETARRSGLRTPPGTGPGGYGSPYGQGPAGAKHPELDRHESRGSNLADDGY